MTAPSSTRAGSRNEAAKTAPVADSDASPPTPPVPTPRLYPMGGLLGELETDAARRRDALLTGNPLGALSGLRGLDERLGGCLEVGTHVIHGSPGVGKTAFALQLAASCGCPALFVTCEVLPIELLRRHTARVTGTYLGKFKDGSLTPAAILEQARRAVATAPLLGILDGTCAPATPASIVEAAATVRRFAPENPHLLIVLDSLHTWADALGAGEEYERLNAALAALRTLATQERAAVVFIAERNRQSREKGGQASGAGTRKIEYSAETVIGLQSTQTDANDCPVYDNNGETEIDVVISKNRHGEVGRALPLLFSGRCQRYRESNSGDGFGDFGDGVGDSMDAAYAAVVVPTAGGGSSAVAFDPFGPPKSAPSLRYQKRGNGKGKA